MQFLHERIWGESGLRAPVATHKFTALNVDTPASVYTRFGIPPELVTAAHFALHCFAKQECSSNEGWTQARAFESVVRALPASARPHPDAESYLVLFALAGAYGLSFASLVQGKACITLVHETIAPHFQGLTSIGRSRAMWQSVGKVFALLGAHMRCEPIPERVANGMTTQVLNRLLSLLAAVDLKKPVPACKLLRLAASWKEIPLGVEIVSVLVSAHPHRLDDLAVLLMGDELSEEAARQFLEFPELFAALNLSATRELLGIWDPKDGPLLDAARFLAPDLLRNVSTR